MRKSTETRPQNIVHKLVVCAVVVTIFSACFALYNHTLLQDIPDYSFTKDALPSIVIASLLYALCIWLLFRLSTKWYFLGVVFSIFFSFAAYEMANGSRSQFGATWLASEVFWELVIGKGNAVFIGGGGLLVTLFSSLFIRYEKIKHSKETHLKYMLLHIPRITIKSLTENQHKIYKTLDTLPYGETLAQQVAKKLQTNPSAQNGLYFSHRDYCGLGLFYKEKRFILCEVYDGYPEVEASPKALIASFNSQKDFITWLAHENDQSMARYGTKFNNQTITKLRLLWFLEPEFSSNWNAYCNYERGKLAK